MTPSTWPALIVGAFTILNPSTPAGPTTAETDASPITITSPQLGFESKPLYAQSYILEPNVNLSTTTDLGTVTIAAPTTISGTGVDGKPYTFTINPTAPGASVLTYSMEKQPDLTSIDHMPVIGYGSDPNKMDQMCWWDGTDPNKIDHMATGYNSATTKFYNSASSIPAWSAPTTDSWKNYLKNFSPQMPPAPATPPSPKLAPAVPPVPSPKP